MLTLVLLTALAASEPAPADTLPIECDACEEWNATQQPFRVHGNTWYVGPRGLASLLIDTGGGLILLDGALPQSAAQIVANLRTLGFDIADVKWIGVSHAHFDHVGGIAALARLSGAQVVASPHAAQALRRGNVPPDDPQAGMGEHAMRFPAVAAVVEIADAAQVSLGDFVLTAHHTPGHTPGGTSWSWRSCDASGCVNMVYADSLTPVAADGFRFSDDASRVAQFRRSIERVRALPCDVLIATHPGFTGLFAALERRRDAPQPDPLIDPDACRAYAERAARRLDLRIEEEGPAAAPRPSP